ncbi:MAG: creD [Bacteroidetes bacterium]|nr:creD [Bacteroidota bacterium]
METTNEKIRKISDSLTLKAVIIGVLTLIMLIPGALIQDLIRERQNRSTETIEKINSKWSNAQTINGPLLVIPYKKTITDDKKNIISENHTYTLTPEMLQIKSVLTPRERHYGIYKSILYESDILISGNFRAIASKDIDGEPLWDKAYVLLGISDLRGISNNIKFEVNGQNFIAQTSGKNDVNSQELIINLNTLTSLKMEKKADFQCKIKLKGSSNLNFVPIGRNTQVQVEGKWNAPGFIGNFSPDYTLNKNGFTAKWNILHYNRNIPEFWIDDKIKDISDNTFGVRLVEATDHYLLNMRSSKYSLMFIVLTFVVFFFVEVLTRKRIHPLQYLLVGVALILFYSLLLSLSEQLSFGFSYLIASVSTIGLIIAYAGGIFKNKTQTGILAVMLTVLYIFLYVVLQLEDVALLIGSIGLFIILGIIMFLSHKINWYQNDSKPEKVE